MAGTRPAMTMRQKPLLRPPAYPDTHGARPGRDTGGAGPGHDAGADGA
jgi:hypothetical protein